MPLVLDKNNVLDVYAKAAQDRWVVPTFCTENLTTTEAVLAASVEYGQEIGRDDLPITIAITNRYHHRSQSVNYTHCRKWDIGLKLFMADINVLTGKDTPYCKLNVMTHLDHTQHDVDAELLKWDMNLFSMIMFDASSLPLEDNIKLTADFVEKQKDKIVIEGACDEIVDATGTDRCDLTIPAKAADYCVRTGVDYIVANLGTEHRASSMNLEYHGELARQISAIIGKKLVLHGTSSVNANQIKNLFDDGIAKVNIWTILERDSSPYLFEDMIVNAAKIIGKKGAQSLLKRGLLGENVDIASSALLSHYTTTYRQNLVFEKMKEIVKSYLRLWYV